MKHFYVLLTVVLFILQGCATKEATVELNHQEVKTETTPTDTLKDSTSDEEKTENTTQMSLKRNFQNKKLRLLWNH